MKDPVTPRPLGRLATRENRSAPGRIDQNSSSIPFNSTAGSVPLPKPYMYAEELARFTPWTPEAIRKMASTGTFKFGVHYFQTGGRGTRLFFKWEAIVEMIEGADRRRVAEPVPAPCRQDRVRRLDAKKAEAELRRLLDRGA